MNHTIPSIQAGGDGTTTTTTTTTKVLVWDLPVRVFHWLLAGCFAGAYLTAELDSLRLVHVTLGYTVAGLVGFRIVWGLVGTRHARFASFVRGPRAVGRYLASLRRGRPEHHSGHNPAGALAIVAMLGLALLVTLSGWANYTERGGEWLEEAHELAANLMLALVGLHIAGVLLASLLHGHNLVGAMVSGRKPGRPQDGIGGAWRGVALALLLAVLGFWYLQWRDAPAGGGLAGKATAESQQHKAKARSDDD